ncbi:hypothetical protein [Paraliobacillus sp. X-1268]|uniref:hypothetical protein n=1 Tax=Paraliobacillus sp. X-1268 TaxID=2213193 RepID=UPI00130048E2|nr:hypothetical protein [Paraliobacillus sp. X-1268]
MSDEVGDLISDSTSLTEVLNIIQKKDCVFVLEKDRVTKLVTVADLHKQPIRMLAFSLISILEMSLIELIKGEYQNDDWKDLLSELRVNLANKLFKDRRNKNEALSLIDSIQICDKGTIIEKSDYLRDKLGFSSKQVCKIFFKKVEKLRNNIAHSQEQISLDHKELIEIVLQVKEVLNITLSNSIENEIILTE